MEYVYLATSLLYTFLILNYIKGWIRTPKFIIPEGYTPQTTVSVIIPFRNEIDHLPVLLDCLHKQKFTNQLVTYIFVNDHSDDGGEKIVEGYLPLNSNWILLNSPDIGKKNALRFAYKKLKSDLVVTLDADCIVNKNWLLTMIAYAELEGKDFVIGPVKLDPTKTFWQKIQSIEFQSLIASGAGAAGNNAAIMCNGANLAFRSAYIQSNIDLLKANYASGDDMFLLEHIKRENPTKIGFVKSKNAMVYTEPLGLKKFINQRARWASKAKGYSDKDILFSGFIVILINVILLISLPFIFFDSNFLKYFLFLFLSKMFVDGIFLKLTSSFFKTKTTLFYIPLISFLYPFYTITSSILGITNNFQWKGRK